MYAGKVDNRSFLATAVLLIPSIALALAAASARSCACPIRPLAITLAPVANKPTAKLNPSVSGAAASEIAPMTAVEPKPVIELDPIFAAVCDAPILRNVLFNIKSRGAAAIPTPNPSAPPLNIDVPNLADAKAAASTPESNAACDPTLTAVFPILIMALCASNAVTLEPTSPANPAVPPTSIELMYWLPVFTLGPSNALTPIPNNSPAPVLPAISPASDAEIPLKESRAMFIRSENDNFGAALPITVGSSSTS